MEVIEVGVHHKVRVHSCDDIISSDRANLVSPNCGALRLIRAIPCWVLGITLWVFHAALGRRY